MNYIAVFLTLNCNMDCSYCINKYDKIVYPKSLSADEWIKGLSKVETRQDLPLTLQGGEPTIHPEFYKIVNGLKEKHLDLLTNGKFDVKEFAENIPPDAFKRQAKYASLRFSYHSDTDLLGLLYNVNYLKVRGYNVGVWGVAHPDMETDNLNAKIICNALNIDYREKEFLSHDSGTYKYPNAIGQNKTKEVMCKTSELLIAPDGNIFKCHADLYAGREPIGNILSDDKMPELKFRKCNNYGHCNPCDQKITFDRFQQNGHCSVEIKECQE